MQTPYFTKQDSTSFSSRIALSLLHFFGWKLRYNGLPGTRGVIIFYPHTSNWDFFYGILAKWTINFPLKYLVKESLFQGVTGFFLGRIVRYWGGEPIERGVSSGAIPKMAQRIQAADWFWLAIAPEGTRSYTTHLRSGFYHIALTAKVPLVCAFIDYGKKEIGISRQVELSGDEATDLARIQEVYQGMTGQHPNQQSPIVFKN